MSDLQEPGRLLVEPHTVGVADPVVRLEGELDLATAPTLMETAADLIAHGAAMIRFDCTRLEYMDSAGLACLLQIIDMLGSAGSVRLHQAPDVIGRLLDVTGLTDIIVLDDRPLPEARRSMATEASASDMGA